VLDVIRIECLYVFGSNDRLEFLRSERDPTSSTKNVLGSKGHSPSLRFRKVKEESKQCQLLNIVSNFLRKVHKLPCLVVIGSHELTALVNYVHSSRLRMANINAEQQ